MDYDHEYIIGLSSANPRLMTSITVPLLSVHSLGLPQDINNDSKSNKR